MIKMRRNRVCSPSKIEIVREIDIFVIFESVGGEGLRKGKFEGDAIQIYLLVLLLLYIIILKPSSNL